ncbi:hypothetical protein TNCV_1285341 [Trichonephila clavipes]|uniref:Uncharacterized protein n=1 Tax=Trichonephila clavipes TaxID=2585209 RepID=A0A8X6VK81_TRICX|nr:hypothetical protein TNCV_1285341 [Trichonephila clavipes]
MTKKNAYFCYKVYTFSLKTPAALLQGTSLLRQIRPVNGHTMRLCPAHCAYSHAGVESQEANKKIMTSKPCDLFPAHKASHLLYIL